MEELITYIISKIVADPTTAKIEKEDVNGEIYFHVYVPEEERGIIIGKEGRNIKAIRNLISILAKKEGKRVYIKIRD